MLNKTKAALQSRSCQLTTSNSSFQDSTETDQVKTYGYAAMQYNPGTAASLAKLNFSRLNFKPSNFTNLFGSIFCRRNIAPADFYHIFELQICNSVTHVNELIQKILIRRLVSDFYKESLSVSRANLRWRRFISVLAAAIRKPAMLSSGCLTFSIISKSSRGSLTETWSDLLFLLPVAIAESPYVRWCSVCLRKISNQALTWCSPLNILVVFTSFELVSRNDEARQCVNTNRASYHNVIEAYIMAELQSIQTHPEFTYNTKFFTWRFMALSATDSHVIHITATTEREAREQSPQGCVMVFAGRLPSEVRNA